MPTLENDSKVWENLPQSNKRWVTSVVFFMFHLFLFVSTQVQVKEFCTVLILVHFLIIIELLKNLINTRLKIEYHSGGGGVSRLSE